MDAVSCTIHRSVFAVQSGALAYSNQTKMCRMRSKRKFESQEQKSNEYALSAHTNWGQSNDEQKVITSIATTESSSTRNIVANFMISHSLKDCLSNPATTCTCLPFASFLPLAVISILYLIFLPTTFSMVLNSGPTPWGDACGIYVIVEEHHQHGPLHGAQKERALCELRGNISKQIISIRRFMGPKNFPKVWSKHNNSYAYLKVAKGRNITLRTWHKQLQVYVATADRLFERAYNYKILQQNTWASTQQPIDKADRDLQRLRHLIITTRSIICDLELTANLLVRRTKKIKNTPTIDATAMRARIHLKSDKRTAIEGVDPIDINMLYQRLRRSLLHMRKTLKGHCGKSSDRGKQQQKKNKEEKTQVVMQHKQKVSKVDEALRNKKHKRQQLELRQNVK